MVQSMYALCSVHMASVRWRHASWERAAWVPCMFDFEIIIGQFYIQRPFNVTDLCVCERGGRGGGIATFIYVTPIIPCRVRTHSFKSWHSWTGKTA